MNSSRALQQKNNRPGLKIDPWLPPSLSFPPPLRALRPDRITNALQNFCEKIMGSQYVNQDAFNAAVMMEESSSSTPIFFILFPGYSPSKEIEVYANKMGKSVANGLLTLISMGQGQESPAEAVLDKYTKVNDV